MRQTGNENTHAVQSTHALLHRSNNNHMSFADYADEIVKNVIVVVVSSCMLLVNSISYFPEQWSLRLKAD